MSASTSITRSSAMASILAIGFSLIFDRPHATAEDPKEQEEQRKEIKKTADEFVRFWGNEVEMHFACFSQTADVIDHFGKRYEKGDLPGKFNPFFRGAGKGSKITIDIESIRFVGKDAAVIDGTWKVADLNIEEMKKKETATGRFVCVTAKTTDKHWRIESLRVNKPIEESGKAKQK